MFLFVRQNLYIYIYKSFGEFQTLFWKDGRCNDESPSHIGKVVTFIVITNYIGLNRLLVTTTFQNYLYSQPPASVALPVTVGATDNCIAPHTSHLMWENKTFKGRPYVFCGRQLILLTSEF